MKRITTYLRDLGIGPTGYEHRSEEMHAFIDAFGPAANWVRSPFERFGSGPRNLFKFTDQLAKFSEVVPTNLDMLFDCGYDYVLVYNGWTRYPARACTFDFINERMFGSRWTYEAGIIGGDWFGFTSLTDMTTAYISISTPTMLSSYLADDP